VVLVAQRTAEDPACAPQSLGGTWVTRLVPVDEQLTALAGNGVDTDSRVAAQGGRNGAPVWLLAGLGDVAWGSRRCRNLAGGRLAAYASIGMGDANRRRVEGLWRRTGVPWVSTQGQRE